MSANDGNRTQFWRWLRIGLAGSAIALLILFVGVNFQSVHLDFVVAETEMRLAFALILAALLGFLLGFIASNFRAWP